MQQTIGTHNLDCKRRSVEKKMPVSKRPTLYEILEKITQN